MTCEEGMPHSEVWRALYSAAFFKGDCSKITIAVNGDIDADNADALLWAMSYRTNPVKDIKTLDYRGQGHGQNVSMAVRRTQLYLSMRQ